MFAATICCFSTSTSRALEQYDKFKGDKQTGFLYMVSTNHFFSQVKQHNITSKRQRVRSVLLHFASLCTLLCTIQENFRRSTTMKPPPFNCVFSPVHDDSFLTIYKVSCGFLQMLVYCLCQKIVFCFLNV